MSREGVLHFLLSLRITSVFFFFFFFIKYYLQLLNQLTSKIVDNIILDKIILEIILFRSQQRGGRWASWHGPTIWGLLPLVEAKGGPLIKNIDIVKFEMGPTFPIWPGYPSCRGKGGPFGKEYWYYKVWNGAYISRLAWAYYQLCMDLILWHSI